MKKLIMYSASSGIYFKGALKEACKLMTPSITAIEWMRDDDYTIRSGWENECDFLVVHGSPPIIEKQTKGDELIYIGSRLEQLKEQGGCEREVVVIFLSAGILSQSSWSVGEEGKRLSVFYLQNTVGVQLGSHSPMNNEQIQLVGDRWYSFLRLLSDQAELSRYFNGDFSTEGAQKIRGFILGPLPVALLTALSILCQGYLAIHASADSKQEGEKNRENGKVAEALERMGWTTLCHNMEERELLIAASRMDDGESILSFTEQWSKVKDVNAEFWKPLADEKDLEKRVRDEWRTLQKDQPPKEISWLVSAIAENKAIDQPVGVAKAYLVLARALEAK